MKLLIVAGGAASGSGELPEKVKALIEQADQVLVVAPRLPGRFDWLTSATDKATEQADERLGTILGQLEQLGSPAEGELGADDPLLALDDAVREFSPDHVLIGLRSEENSDWQERGLLDKVDQRLDVPFTVFRLD